MTGTLPRHGLARVISKLGAASRTQAAGWVREGRVRVDGRQVLDPDYPVRQGVARIEIDGGLLQAAARMVVMLNKPRGLITTRTDERNRDTVYGCFEGASLPWLAPVGRLDKASEGLLLFTNDPVWAAKISDPGSGPDKTYHAQIDRIPDDVLLAALAQGASCDGELLRFKAVRMLRTGQKNAWLEILLDEGRNRHIRRLLSAFEVSVLRLVRVAVGTLDLKDLPKGGWRLLSAAEIDAL
jgi:23S rRNA pseudouridine2605 synthase